MIFFCFLLPGFCGRAGPPSAPRALPARSRARVAVSSLCCAPVAVCACCCFTICVGTAGPTALAYAACAAYFLIALPNIRGIETEDPCVKIPDVSKQNMSFRHVPDVFITGLGEVSQKAIEEMSSWCQTSGRRCTV